MKKLTLTTLALLSTAPLYASDLTLTVSNIQSEKGALDMVIYNNEQAFNTMSKNAFAAISLPVYNKNVSVTLANFPAGRYAVCVQHDTNNNGKLDTGKNKLPTEAYACSNNAGKTTAPTFKAAEFTHGDKNSVVNLSLIQPH